VDVFSEKLNNLLVETFRDILKFEEKMLNSFDQLNLSISEVHMLESVGKSGNTPKTISELSQDLSITLPSVTNAIKKLEAAGYVQKTKSSSDGRSVLVELTRKGQRVDAAHRYFHRQMVGELSRGLSAEDKEHLMRGIERLDNFFKGKLDETKYELKI